MLNQQNENVWKLSYGCLLRGSVPKLSIEYIFYFCIVLRFYNTFNLLLY